MNAFLYALGKLPDMITLGTVALTADANGDKKLSTEEAIAAAAKALPALLDLFGVKVKDNPALDTSEKIEQAILELETIPLPQWLKNKNLLHD